MDPVQDNAVSIVTEEEIPNSSDVNRTEADKRATDSVYESQGVIGSGAYSEVVKVRILSLQNTLSDICYRC